MKPLFLSLLATVIVSISACKKKTNDPHADDTTAFSGVVSISSPVEGDTVTGSTFVVKGAITANQEMHGYHVFVSKQSDGTKVYENQAHAHGSSLNISETITHNLTEITPLNILVEGAGDHSGSTISKQIKVIYKP